MDDWRNKGKFITQVDGSVRLEYNGDQSVFHFKGFDFEVKSDAQEMLLKCAWALIPQALRILPTDRFAKINKMKVVNDLIETHSAVLPQIETIFDGVQGDQIFICHCVDAQKEVNQWVSGIIRQTPHVQYILTSKMLCYTMANIGKDLSDRGWNHYEDHFHVPLGYARAIWNSYKNDEEYNEGYILSGSKPRR